MACEISEENLRPKSLRPNLIIRMIKLIERAINFLPDRQTEAMEGQMSMKIEDKGPVSIVGISGSLRKASFSTEILRVLAKESAPAIHVHLVTLEEIPPYNEDLDTATGVPAVNALKRLISASDGVLISTPEYNHGIPGVLKNALDWLSRPVFESCFKDKPVSIISSSKAFTGGVRAQYQLRETLISMHAQLVTGPEVVVGGIHRNLGDEFYADEDGLAFMLKSLNRLRDAALCLQKQLQMEMLAGNETGSFCYSPPDENRNQAIAKQIAPLPHAILQRVTEYMEEHLQDNLSLDQLARETDYSRAHFLRMFRATTGKTPHQYLTQRRIERAKSMLLEAEKQSLTDIAASCGFSSQSHMTRVFREQVGVTPSEFKRRPDLRASREQLSNPQPAC
jgi:chromate reductase, NAD(P)H dehydrogenase (quinone)